MTAITVAIAIIVAVIAAIVWVGVQDLGQIDEPDDGERL